MMKWRKIADIVNFYTKGITPSYVKHSKLMVLNQKCIRNHRIDYSLAQYTDDTKNISQNKIIRIGDILINSTGQGTAGRCAFVNKLPSHIKLITDSHVLLLRCNSYYEAQCLSYSLFSYEKILQTYIDGSTGQGEFDKIRLFNLLTSIPVDPIKQRDIGVLLSSLDAKIELNTRINAELETMAKTLYDYWFVQFDFPNEKGKPYKSSCGKMVWNKALKREIPEGWEVGNLLDIADYINGLACQKFRPNSDDFLRVIKIKEMHSGFSEDSELVRADFPKKAIIENGDVLFSWSASLEVQIWSGGKGALNQHIFKVVSKKFPKSFYYYQLINYLQHFKMLAEKRKTTMGHITQEHLQQSRIVIPPMELLLKLDNIIAPIFEKKLNNDIQNQELAELRDWLLPMLMNGQVKVKDAEDVEESLSMTAESQAAYGTK